MRNWAGSFLTQFGILQAAKFIIICFEVSGLISPENGISSSGLS
jgi:hypothetical protein